MRSILLLFIPLCLSSVLSAQYTQNAPPVQQYKAEADDCYTLNLDKGNAALRRDEPLVAMRFFELAKSCPEVQGNTRRINELDDRIERCREALGIKNATEVTNAKPSSGLRDEMPSVRKRSSNQDVSNARRAFPARREFLRDTLGDCFDETVSEADRAFRLRFWEDAAALYRAAKNCADADQNDRQRMTERIDACRDAAENELFARQQEAERQARHAIASNLADDAHELLKSVDRSLAFRLADFANQYIAPDDNNDCIQAMFDAWYHQPADISKHRLDQLYHPVFCYELANNLGDNTQLKFQQQKDGAQWLWAFSPSKGDVFAWELPDMKPVQSFGAGENKSFYSFDITPAGDMLFIGDKSFEVRRGNRTYRVELPSTGPWCFSERGDEFFYLDKSEQTVYIVNIREAFAQQSRSKGAKSAPVAMPTLRAIISGVPDTLLSMAYYKGKFWLGYRDRLEILHKPNAGQAWARERVVLFEGTEATAQFELQDIRLQLYPASNMALLGYYGGAWHIQLKPDNTARITAYENLRPLCMNAKAGQLALEYTADNIFNNLWLLDTEGGDTLLRQRMPYNLDYYPMSGAFSPDARWLAASSYTGNIAVWALKETPTSRMVRLAETPNSAARLSPDGNQLFLSQPDSLFIFNTRNPQNKPLLFANKGISLDGVANHWVLYPYSNDSIEIQHLDTGRKLRFPLPYITRIVGQYAFDSRETEYVAYLSDWEKVTVRSLKTGALVSEKIFEGGNISHLHFLPDGVTLLVVQRIAVGESSAARSSVKCWKVNERDNRPRSVRLHDYPVQYEAVSTRGDKLAFSNQYDIRVFDMGDFENEALRIRATQNLSVKSIAFRPNSDHLAAAYENGLVIFWDVNTGQSFLRLQVAPENGLSENISEVSAIGFSEDGALMHLYVSDGRLYTYSVDANYIRVVAQNENKQLESFSFEQIEEYELEPALDYPGNFERLAQSGDQPLIGSFFEYFRQQAVESNNIERVRLYCERALYLYERLNKNTQELWSSDMRLMFEDYSQKLILRGKLKDAAVIIRMLPQQFKYKPTLLEAHLALLQREYTKAATLYSNHLLSREESISYYNFNTHFLFEQVEKEMLQLRDYGLIDSVQNNCFCGVVRRSGAFPVLCPKGQNYPDRFMAGTDLLRWEVYQKRHIAMDRQTFATRIALLEEAEQKARALVKQQPGQHDAWEEKSALNLAQAHLNRATFERTNPEAKQHYETAAHTLIHHNSFKGLSDTIRLGFLALNYLYWGNYLLNTGQQIEAIDKFNQGLIYCKELSEQVYSIDSVALIPYYNDLVGPLYEKMATAYLMEGKPTEARQLYESANNYYYSNGLNALHFGNVSAFEGKREEAYINYGSIDQPVRAALVGYTLNRLWHRFPEKRAFIEPLWAELKEALGRRNKDFNGPQMEYWFSAAMRDHYVAFAQWDSAADWTLRALQQAKRCVDADKNETVWQNTWMDEHINISYYLLMAKWNKQDGLESAIDYIEEAKAYLHEQSDEFLYQNEGLLDLNLAHALMLRNKGDDQERAKAIYDDFLENYISLEGFDNRDILGKDIRDLKKAGAVIQFNQ